MGRSIDKPTPADSVTASPGRANAWRPGRGSAKPWAGNSQSQLKKVQKTMAKLMWERLTRREADDATHSPWDEQAAPWLPLDMTDEDEDELEEDELFDDEDEDEDFDDEDDEDFDDDDEDFVDDDDHDEDVEVDDDDDDDL